MYNAADTENDSILGTPASPTGTLWHWGSTSAALRSGKKYMTLRELLGGASPQAGSTLSLLVTSKNKYFNIKIVSWERSATQFDYYSYTETTTFSHSYDRVAHGDKPLKLELPKELNSLKPAMKGATPQQRKAAKEYNDEVEIAILSHLEENDLTEATVEADVFALEDSLLSAMELLKVDKKKKVWEHLPSVADFVEDGKDTIAVRVPDAARVTVLTPSDCLQPTLWIGTNNAFKICSGDLVNVTATGLIVGGQEYLAGDDIPEAKFTYNNIVFSQRLYVGSMGSVGSLTDPCVADGFYESIKEGEKPSKYGCTWGAICLAGRGPACSATEDFEWCSGKEGQHEYFDVEKSTPTSGCKRKGTMHVEDGVCYTC